MGQYKAACGRLGPELARLKGIFERIVAGEYDNGQTAHTELCVDAELESIRDALRASLDPNPRPEPPL